MRAVYFEINRIPFYQIGDIYQLGTMAEQVPLSFPKHPLCDLGVKYAAMEAQAPIFAACEKLDFEVEVATVMSKTRIRKACVCG